MNKRQLKKKLKEMELLLQEKEGLEQKESQEDYYIEQLQRLQAEFENYRKRVEKEKSQITVRARMDILSDFVALCDMLSEAAQKRDPNESQDVESYRRGVELILKQFVDFLFKEGVKPIEVEGQIFDPKFHEALMTEEGQQEHSGRVAREIQKGYLYNGLILRPARVSVYK
jgi:molecular chaperone GrpE